MLRATLHRCCAAGTASAKKKKFQVAVVGSGPGGCYVAHHLLKHRSDVHIDIFEKLPVPFGLSRYGVAPDHPEVKNVEKTFKDMLEQRRGDVSLLTNVTIGHGGIPLEALQEHYSAVVLAHGADAERRLNIPGERLGQVFPAKRFVEYYNTLPTPLGDPRTCPIDLDKARRVVIIGNGNVALDCARVLTVPYRHFCPTDMNCFAVRALMESQLDEVVVVGRRDVEHSAFTTKEFREIATLTNAVKVHVEPFDLDAAVARSASMRGKKRQLELMHKYCPATGDEAAEQAKQQKEAAAAGRAPMYPLYSDNDMRTAFSVFAAHREGLKQKGADPRTVKRNVHFAYNLKPVEIVKHPANPKVAGGVIFEDARDQKRVLIPCDAVLTSVGYKTTPLGSAPFDEERAVIPNHAGRVDGGKRLYVAGWAKTGPRGVIVSTMQAANETAAAIAADFDKASASKADAERGAAREPSGAEVETEEFAAGPLGATNEGKYGLIEHMIKTQMEPLSYQQVKKIWFFEGQRGVDLGKANEKCPSVQDMLDIAGEGIMSRRAKDRFLGNATARPPGLEMLEDWLDPDTEIIDLSDPKRTNPEMNIRL